MKVLVCLLHFGYHRNLASVIVELARRGHHVHVAAEKGDRDRAREVVEALAREHPTITIGTLPLRERDQYLEVVQRLRLGSDYLRYLEPEYAGMPGLLARAEDRVPIGVLRLLATPGMQTRPGRRLLRAALRTLERAIPPSAAIEAYLRQQSPDVMLITPLIGVVTSSQIDYVAAARRLGIPSGFAVWSWDNLSSKALMRDRTDRVFVWNDTQRDEAVDLHGMPPDSVVVTGAQCFDQWFNRSPSRTREEFCRAVGLPPHRPYVLYVGSSLVWKSPPEAEFVVRWIRHLRRSQDPVVRGVPVLIRPHPGRLDEWQHIDVSALEGIAFSGAVPGTGVGAGFPIDADSRNDYFDALYYSAAVVGINTSAFIEAGILGRPAFSILAEEFAGSQSGTIHFRYLTGIAGGVVDVGRAFDEHESQLARCLAGDTRHEERQRRFVETFVRPRGLDLRATDLFADAVETLGRQAGASARVGTHGGAPHLARLALRWLAEGTQRGRGKRLLMTRDEYAAATVNETRRRPYLSRVGERSVKRARRARRQVAKARKRTWQLSLRIAIAARDLVFR